MQQDKTPCSTIRKNDWGALRSFTRAARFYVKRDYNRLDKSDKTFLCTLAEIDRYENFAKYDYEQRQKLAYAFRRIRKLSKAFNHGNAVSIKDFICDAEKPKKGAMK
ncbi:hypothetical protein HPC38_01715 [Pasteurellaceae bacterium HPA106]|uniref:hypothetical protein n=1 Tax=Spirabiliibacterium pneumoniae TaxID=221400 RepID=UPI001AACB48C|nr:hypothetical protein [Spirabiliibacterium pneumoniae]MBE2895593.1 hypothetical protein [Spirabiliibacterium pneumoniae]